MTTLQLPQSSAPRTSAKAATRRSAPTTRNIWTNCAPRPRSSIADQAMSSLFSRPLALTQGDPAGIGPDITLVAWTRRTELGLPPFLFIGDPKVLEGRMRQLGLT